MSATLKVTRQTLGVMIRRGRFDVWLDGEIAGQVEMRSTMEVPVEPGRHSLKIRNGRNSSRTKTFEVADGQVVEFRCSGKNILPIFLLSFAVPSLAITLRRIQ